jgi:hypothetical protein
MKRRTFISLVAAAGPVAVAPVWEPVIRANHIRMD